VKTYGPFGQAGDAVMWVAFSPDGESIALAVGDKTARVIETSTGKAVATYSHNSGVTSVAFSPDGKQLATGTFDGTVTLWNLPTKETLGNGMD
jgi:WD40 repeat protein